MMLSHLSGYAPGSDAMFNFKIMLVAAAVVGHIYLPIFAGFSSGKGCRHTGRLSPESKSPPSGYASSFL